MTLPFGSIHRVVTKHVSVGLFVILSTYKRGNLLAPFYAGDCENLCIVTIAVTIPTVFLIALGTSFLHLQGSLGAIRVLACRHVSSVSLLLVFMCSSFPNLSELDLPAHFYYSLGAFEFLPRSSPY